MATLQQNLLKQYKKSEKIPAILSTQLFRRINFFKDNPEIVAKNHLGYAYQTANADVNPFDIFDTYAEGETYKLWGKPGAIDESGKNVGKSLADRKKLESGSGPSTLVPKPVSQGALRITLI